MTSPDLKRRKVASAPSKSLDEMVRDLAVEEPSGYERSSAGGCESLAAQMCNFSRMLDSLRQAYLFSPNSHTHDALTRAYHVEAALQEIRAGRREL